MITSNRLKPVTRCLFQPINRDIFTRQEIVTRQHHKNVKKSNGKKLRDTNFAAKTIAGKLSILDRVEVMQETEAYITTIDHKDEFPNKTPCRLINPSRSNIGKISKAILDTINKNTVGSTEINQRKNTSNLLDWYANYTDKNKASFVQFDIENFYPSITSDLLYNSIQFANEATTVADNDIHNIMQSRKTLLFNEKKPWVKRCGDEDFDVPMGCYDGAEVCELVGSYLLKKVSSIVDKKSIGLYRDDGLAILQNLSGPQIEQKRKDIIKMLKTAGLNITIQAGFPIVNFLNAQFNLNNGRTY